MKQKSFLQKRIALLLSIVVLAQVLFMATPSSSFAEEAIDLKLAVKSAILMDAASGTILYEMNADIALPPASMAKMMTEYLVMEAIESGKIKLDDKVTASQYAADVIGSGGQIAKGEQLTVKQLFSAMSIYSANDASVALAEYISGTEENFAKEMNSKARELGLSANANFINATGLSRADLGKYAPTTVAGETLMSAKDAAILARRVILDHKDVLTYTKIPSQKLREKDPAPMINWNWMLEGNKDNVNFKKYSFPGLDGLKTGHTVEAGYCFTSTAERNGMRLISVVMGTATEPKRFEETRKVLEYGFNNFEMKTVLTAQSTMESLKTVKLKKGDKKEIAAVTESGLSIIVKKGTTDSQITKEAIPSDASKLIAPIKKGQVVGLVKVTYNNKTHEVNLVASEDMNKANWFKLLFRAIGTFFSELFAGIKNLF